MKPEAQKYCDCGRYRQLCPFWALPAGVGYHPERMVRAMRCGVGGAVRSGWCPGRAVSLDKKWVWGLQSYWVEGLRVVFRGQSSSDVDMLKSAIDLNAFNKFDYGVCALRLRGLLSSFQSINRAL